MGFYEWINRKKITQEKKYYTREEVMKHKNHDDCWIIYKNKIYDVTKFLNSHPGGKNIILKYAGLDCTKDFDKSHEYINIDEVLFNEMKGYIIN